MSCSLDSPRPPPPLKTDFLDTKASSSTFSTSPNRTKRKSYEGKEDHHSPLGGATAATSFNRNLSPRKRKRIRFYSGSSASQFLTVGSSNDSTIKTEHEEQEKERWKRRMSYKRSQSFSVHDPLGLDPNPRPLPVPINNGLQKPPGFIHTSGQKHRRDKVINFPKICDRHDPLKLNVQIQAYEASHPHDRDGRPLPCKRERQAEKFRYGNYNRYYGYREVGTDPRFALMSREWFDGKDCLDIGCNTGQFTLALTKKFMPRMMIGIDIDKHLIRIAQKNIRHYLTDDICQRESFPKSLPILYGPVVAPAIFDPNSDGPKMFPYNITFMECDYVPADNAQHEQETEEFDSILALSVTKWIHLNWGDNGLKRFFKRIFRHLRPGGRFILEPQEWCSYTSGKNKGKLTMDMRKTFASLEFKPEHFADFLTSSDVGFTSFEKIDLPSGTSVSKGFKRGIYVFLKADEVDDLQSVDKNSPCSD